MNSTPAQKHPHKTKLNLQSFYNKGTYAITISPNDKHQYFGNLNRLTKYQNFITEQLLHLSSYGISLLLYYELSEPLISNPNKSPNGPRLHNHGTITFHSNNAIKRFLLIDYYKITRYASLYISTIDDYNLWLQYCSKQQHYIQTEPLLITKIREHKIQSINPSHTGSKEKLASPLLKEGSDGKEHTTKLPSIFQLFNE